RLCVYTSPPCASSTISTTPPTPSSRQSSFDAPAPNDTYALSLHDALPIYTCTRPGRRVLVTVGAQPPGGPDPTEPTPSATGEPTDRKSTRLNSSHVKTSYAVFCLKTKTHCPAPPPPPQHLVSASASSSPYV